MANNDSLKIEYWPLSEVITKRWGRNPKKHSLELLIESFKRHGFRDPIGFDTTLSAFVEGNGRATALAQMKEAGGDIPRGIKAEDDEWMIPILCGVDAKSKANAEAYAFDHNNLTLAGAGFDDDEIMQIWDDDASDIIRELAEEDEMPLGLSDDYLNTPNIEFPEYDESIANDIELCSCQNCGNEHARKKQL